MAFTRKWPSCLECFASAVQSRLISHASRATVIRCFSTLCPSIILLVLIFFTVQHLRKNSFSITISRLGLTRSRGRAELPTLMRRCKADRWKRHRNTCRNSGKGTCSLTLKEAFQMLKSSMQSMVSASADSPLHLLSE